MKRFRVLSHFLLIMAASLLIICLCQNCSYADSYSITYRGNGGTMSDGNTVCTQNVDDLNSVTLLGPDTFTNGEMVFMYWQGSDGEKYLEGGTYSLPYGIRLTAQWGYGRICYYDILPDEEFSELLPFDIQAIKYSWSDARINQEIDASAIGFAFIGWNTKKDGTGEWYKVGQRIESSCKLNLYSQYNILPTNYIRYSSNGSDLFDGKTYMYVAIESFPSDVKLMNLTDIGNCTYVGWNTVERSFEYDSSRSGVRYAAGSTVHLTENTSLYADYYYNDKYYRINQSIASYNGNGGFSGNGSNMIYNASSFANLKLYEADAFTRDGYYIDSWNLSPDGTGKSFAPGESVVGAASTIIRLYAHWTETEGNCIVYYANGGARSDGAKVFVQKVDSYENVQLANYDLFDNSYAVFLGWEDINTGARYFENETITTNSQLSLRAIWGNSRVTYHGNGGIDDENVDEYVYWNVNVIANESLFKNNEKVFIGWNTNADGTGTWYPSNAEYLQDLGRVELYAQWISLPDNYLCLSADGSGVLGGKSFEYYEIADFPYLFDLPAMIDTDDCVGLYWSTTSQNDNAGSLETVNYTPECPIYLTQNLTLYANYVLRKWTTHVVYDGNGGYYKDGGIIVPSASSSIGLSLYSDDAFIHEGYKLVEWNTARDGSGTKYEKGAFIGHLGKILKLYAQWEIDPLATHTLVFDPITVEYGTELLVVLYDENGRMISVNTAKVVDGYPQADVLFTEYSAMEKAILLRIDGETGRPVGIPLEVTY